MKHSMLYGTTVLAALVLSGCVDNDYDLSDIDTTARFEVNDLAIPVNIDPFTLGTMLDIDEDDPDADIQVVDGNYAIMRDGDFSTTSVSFNPINISASDPSASSTAIQTGVSGSLPAGYELSIPLPAVNSAVSYSSSSIPEEIVDIERIGADFSVKYRLSFPQLAGRVNRITLKNVNINFPKGLTGTMSHGSYNSSTGVVTIPAVTVSSNECTFELNCTALDFAAIGGTFTAATHTASINADIRLVSGSLVINSSDCSGSIPSSITLNTDGRLTDISVRSFTGRVNYSITGVNIAPVSLDDLPDVLQQKDTRISMVNPQIYLSVENPLAPYGLSATTGFTIRSIFEDAAGITSTTEHSLDNQDFTMSGIASSTYCLSPSDPAKYLEGFANSEHVPYSSLSSVLYGPGLPVELDIELIRPRVEQRVVDLPVGTGLGIVHGSYRFYAPLELGAGSKIVYTDTEDGWNDEDIDGIVISELKVTTKMTSSLPFDLNLSGYPVDVNGNQISNVRIEGAVIPAGCRDHEVTIRITGEVTHLDGITFTAEGIVPETMKAPLGSSMSVDCKEIRAVVSGYYEKEL